jgi:hypothetical protein
MGRAIDGVKGREWEERLRRYADSQLTVGDFCVWEGVSVLRLAKEAGRWTAWTAIEGKCGHRRSRVGIDWSTEPRVLPASSCGKKVRGNCGRDDAPSQ